MFSCDSISLSPAESAAIPREVYSPWTMALSHPTCPWKTGSENEKKSWGFPRTGSETKVQVQIVYLVGNARKLPVGSVGK